MTDFIDNMGMTLFLLYAIAILSSIVLLIQLAMTLLGFEDLDGMDAGDGMGFLSVRSLTGFFGGFGWTGAILVQNGYSMAAATAAGIAVGLVLMFSVVHLMRLLYSMRESGAVDFNNAVGQVGTVYISIPPGHSGAGQVRITVQGRLRVAPAYTNSPKRIPAEQQVRIRGLVDSGTLLVDPLETD